MIRIPSARINVPVIAYACLLAGLLMSCSSPKIKPLTEVETAQQILLKQSNNAEANTDDSLLIHAIVPGKAMIGREIDIQVELISKQDMQGVKLAYEAGEGLQFRKKWFILDQHSFVQKLQKVEADQVYKKSVTVIPTQEGHLKLNIYAIYPFNNEKRAKLKTISFIIGPVDSNS